MIGLGKGDIGVIFDVDVNVQKSTSHLGLKKGGSKGKWSSYKYVEEVEITDFSQALIEATRQIAEEIKYHQIEYAPIDESRTRDNIVLKKNIVVKQIGRGKYYIGAEDIPYAVRRNYENFKNPETTHYVEKSWDWHMQDYQDILESVVEGASQNIIESMVRMTSGSENIRTPDWGTAQFKL